MMTSISSSGTHVPIQARSARALVRNGWIFSPQTDLLLFGGPFLAGWFLLLVHETFDLKSTALFGRTPLVMLLASAACLDMGHTLSTLFRSYLDPEERANRQFLLFGTPPLVVAGCFTIYWLFGLTNLVYVFMYFRLYHVVRQQYGWMVQSARKANEAEGLNRLLDAIAIYSFTLVPIVWSHFALDQTETRVPLPESKLMQNICVGTFVALAVAYTSHLFRQVSAGNPLNLVKLGIVYTSMISWGAVMFFQSPVLEFTKSIVHSLPYFGIVYVTCHKKALSGRPVSTLFRWRYSRIAYGGVVCLMGVGWVQLLKFLAGFKETGFGWVPFEWVFVTVMVVSLMHYIIDGVIWRRRSFDVFRHI